MSKLNLWVDDKKDPYPHAQPCDVARTYREALVLARSFPDSYDTLYLDHDLGLQDPRTGYDLLIQLQQEGICPPNVVCISFNPAGARRIAQAIANPHPRVDTCEMRDNDV